MAYMTADRRDRGGDRDRPQGRWDREQARTRGGHGGRAAQERGRPPAASRPGARACAAYDGGTGSIAAARGFAGAFLDGPAAARDPAVAPEVRSAVQLVVSELVTNACKFAPGPSVLTLEVSGPALEITVWDGEPSPPVAGAAEPGRIGRHGLEIVLALCTRFEVHREPVGKRVTATLDLWPPAPPGR